MKCPMCGDPTSAKTETRNGRLICLDGPGCVERARAFKWWRAKPWFIEKEKVDG